MLEWALQLRGQRRPAPACEQEQPKPERSLHPTLKLIIRYAGWWVAGLIILMSAFGYIAMPPTEAKLAAAPVQNKLLYYRRHSSAFDLILLGDSLTFTGLHPEFIDPELGTRSINMATFAHWFATQYPLIQDLKRAIPKGTRVLWSIHNWDFDDNLSVQRVYPVGLANAARYWTWGGHNAGLMDNVLYYSPFTRLIVARDEFRASLISRSDRSVPAAARVFATRVLNAPEPQRGGNVQTSPPRNPDLVKIRYPEIGDLPASFRRSLVDTPELRAQLTEYCEMIPSVAGVEIASDHGVINSVILYLRGGGYYRIELLPEFFRDKQRENARVVWRPSDDVAEAFTPPPLAPVSLRMFEAGLQAFKDAHIPVTVNMMEEAPYTTGNQILRRKYREFLDEKVRPIVESYGDDYVHADYSSMTDADYFDYNHLNSQGIAKYTPLLVAKLRETPAFRRAGNGHQ